MKHDENPELALLGSGDNDVTVLSVDEIAARLREAAGSGEVFVIVGRTDVLGYWESVIRRAHRELQRAAEHDPVKPQPRRVRVAAPAGAP